MWGYRPLGAAARLGLAAGAGLTVHDLAHLDKAVKLADPRRMPHLTQGLGFDLAEAFAGDAELLADLFQGAVIAIPQSKSQFEHLALALRQAAQDIVELVLEQAEAGHFGGALGVLVLDEIA